MAAHAAIEKAGLGNGSDALFWLDPFSTEGMLTADKIRPVSHDLRVAAESALVYVARLRDAGPVPNADALDAMELGARRLDLIGMKFQFADEIREAYAHASDSTRKEGLRELGRHLRQQRTSPGPARRLRPDAVTLRDSVARREPAVLAPQQPGEVRSRHAALAIARRPFRAGRSELARTKRLPAARPWNPGAMITLR